MSALLQRVREELADSLLASGDINGAAHILNCPLPALTAEIAAMGRAHKLLPEVLDILEEARSGYISGCGSDLKWDARKQELITDINAAIAAAGGKELEG